MEPVEKGNARPVAKIEGKGVIYFRMPLRSRGFLRRDRRAVLNRCRHGRPVKGESVFQKSPPGHRRVYRGRGGRARRKRRHRGAAKQPTKGWRKVMMEASGRGKGNFWGFARGRKGAGLIHIKQGYLYFGGNDLRCPLRSVH